MKVPLTVIIHTRNEEAQVERCLAGLKGWASEVLVCDMASEDRTVERATPLADRVISVPSVPEFDSARNTSAEAATQSWILFLDADERLTDEIKLTIEQLVERNDPDVAAYQLPFKTISFGRWIKHAGNWWPSYKSPPLLRKGRFHFTGKVHDPARVDGQVMIVRPRNESDAIEHYSHRDLEHYFAKLNRYTTLEVEKLASSAPPSWEEAATRLGATMRWYFDDTSGHEDGPAGFFLSFGSACYEAVAQLKAMERMGVESVPPTAEAFFAVALQASRGPTPTQISQPSATQLFPGIGVTDSPARVSIIVSDHPGPLFLDWPTMASAPKDSVCAITHRNALNILGGGEVQLFESVKALYDQGVACPVGVGAVPSEGALVHCYSLFLEELVPTMRSLNRPYVLTPIYWDRAELAWIAPRLIAAVESATTFEDIRSAYASLRAQAEYVRKQDGFRDRLSPLQQELIAGAAAILPNAACEAEVLQRSVDFPLPPVHVIPNAIAPKEEPEPFDGLPDESFILCVGRIEPNKNQVSLLLAARTLNIPVVLIGSEPVPKYAALCRAIAGGSVQFLGPLSRDRVAYALTRAAVHCLPSFAETPGLVNLEAATRGCPLVCSNRGAEREYFGDGASYCDPLDLDSIAGAIQAAMSSPKPAYQPATWSDVAAELIKVYDLIGSTRR